MFFVFFFLFFFFSFFYIICFLFFKFISHFLDSCNSTNPYRCSLWTELNDREVKGQYRLNSSNITMTFSNWHPNEPNGGIRKRCVDMLQNGTWSDRGCWYKKSLSSVRWPNVQASVISCFFQVELSI